MKFKIILIGFITLISGCRNQANFPYNVESIHGNGRDTSNNSIIKTDSTIMLVDSCVSTFYQSTLEEYIIFDLNAFKLAVTKNNTNRIYSLDLPPDRTNIETCNNDYIALSSACGMSCTGKDFIFMNGNRPNEGYMYCQIVDNNSNIITHHVNEEFEVIFIRNLLNSKEIKANIGPCESMKSYPCGIKKLLTKKDSLLITFDAPAAKPRVKEINIKEILN
ncbi:MAG: hypothetical protein KDD49_05585 [Bacteroidetes bacterium]|nr:hypothetical protein [Bacteroidota bacterium]